MLNVEAEPLVMAFKCEVAKMRDRDASDLEFKRCSKLLSSQSVGEDENRESLVMAPKGSGRGSPLRSQLLVGLAHLKLACRRGGCGRSDRHAPAPSL